MKTVNETIRNWTIEEQKKLAPLIKECKKREAEIMDNAIGRYAEGIYRIVKGNDGVKD